MRRVCVRSSVHVFLITGLFAASGFSVVSGHVFTYAPAAPSGRRVPRGRGRQRRTPTIGDPLRRRRIIDHFSGHVSAGTDLDQWAEIFRRRLDEIIGLSESDTDIEKARHIVNEWVAARLAPMVDEASPVLYPVDIDIDNERGPYTTLRVVGQDTPAFLYSMSNALALQGVLIERVRIETVADRVEDELDVLDVLHSHGHKIEGQDAIDRLRLSILLTKQFTYCLDKARILTLRFLASIACLQTSWRCRIAASGWNSSKIPARCRILHTSSGPVIFSGKTLCDCSTKACCPC